MRGIAGLLVAGFVLALGAAAPAQAFDLFAGRVVDVQFATHDGKPMADAEVLVFAPGGHEHPAVTGRTDKNGKFSFTADRDGFWTAEARNGSEVAQAIVRVGDAHPRRQVPPLYILIGALAMILVLTVGYRYLRTRARRGR